VLATELTGPLSPLATSIDGVWSVDPAGTGCRVTWSWDVHPQGRLGSMGLRVFGKLWPDYVRQALAELERLVVV